MGHKHWKTAKGTMTIIMNFMAVLCAQTAVFVAFAHMQETAYRSSVPVPGLFRQVLVVAAPFAFWQIRERIDSLTAFFALHFLTAAALPFSLGENTAQRGIFFLFVGGYLAESFCIRFRKEEDLPVREDSSVRRIITGPAEEAEKDGASEKEKRKEKPALPEAATGAGAVVPAGMAALSFLACAGMGADWACSRIWILSLAYILLFFASSYLRNLERFVRLNRPSNAHIPVREMLLQGGGMTAGFGITSVLLLGVGVNDALTGPLTEGLKRAGLWLLRCLARAVTFLMSLSKGGERIKAETPMPAAPMPGMEEIAPTPLWMVILEKIFALIFLAAFVLLLLWTLYRTVLWVIRRFYENTERGTIKTDGTVEIREKLVRKKGEGMRKKGLPFLGGSPEERIRKCFIRTIRRTGRFRIPEGEAAGRAFPGRRGPGIREERDRAWEDFARGKTARQLGEASGLMHEETAPAFLELAKLYEKARYGRACTGEDAKRAARAAAVLTACLRE